MQHSNNTQYFLVYVIKKTYGIFNHAEGPDGLRLAKRDCMRSYYKPPPPSDIEKIKRNLAKQRKARGLIVEILGEIAQFAFYDLVL